LYVKNRIGSPNRIGKTSNSQVIRSKVKTNETINEISVQIENKIGYF